VYNSGYWHIETQGNRENPAILFLHGFMGDGKDWADIIRRLKGHYYCITIDLPGHGKTKIGSGKKPYTMCETAKKVIYLLDEISIKQCVIVGYSMGGRLALYLVLRYPERFRQGVLESASPGLQEKAERLSRIGHDHRIASALETTPLDLFLDQWYAQPIFESLKQHPDFYNLLEKRKKNAPDGLARSLRDMGAGIQPSLWMRLKRNRIPLLLLTGEKDPKFGSIAHRMERMCPYAKVHTMSGCGHNIHFEKPSAFCASLRAFIEHERGKAI
jgi:2-succinyl-6-hydroxy-2,4-cyclohexadiene-1-carboxylate synthase